MSLRTFRRLLKENNLGKTETFLNKDIKQRVFQKYLKYCVDTGRFDVADLCLKYGAKINYQNKNKLTILHMIMDGPTAEKIEFLLSRGVDPNIGDRFDVTPLGFLLFDSPLTQEVQCELLPIFEKYNADFLRVGLKHRDTLLHIHFRPHYEKVIEFLLKKGIDPNALDDRGRTCLYFLAADENFREMNFLLIHGVDPNIVNSEGESILKEVSFYGNGSNLRNMTILLNYGATDISFMNNFWKDYKRNSDYRHNRHLRKQQKTYLKRGREGLKLLEDSIGDTKLKTFCISAIRDYGFSTENLPESLFSFPLP